MAGKSSPLGPTGNTVRANIEELRQGAGLSYAEMSRRLEDAGREIPPLGLRRLEAGERKVDVDDLFAISFVLDVSPMRLLLPGVQSSAIAGESTGLGRRSTEELWLWALGYQRPGESPAESREYLRRSSPRFVASKTERIGKRREWISEQIEVSSDLMKRDTSRMREVDPDAANAALQRHWKELNWLESLDPADDEAFAALGSEDPAPPSPEEIAGIFSIENEDGSDE